jgi:ribosomal protein S18 acetylase RimI-like enzyme
MEPNPITLQFEFIPATESDKDYLLQLRKLTMVAHLEKSGQFLTEQQHQARLEYNYHCAFLVRHNGSTIGTLKYQQSGSTIDIMQLQVHPDYQNKGYGKAIMQQIIAEFGVKTVTLTVLKDNPAYQLYLRLGFKLVGEDNYEYHLQLKQH